MNKIFLLFLLALVPSVNAESISKKTLTESEDKALSALCKIRKIWKINV